METLHFNQSGGRGGALRVLLVEDNPINQQLTNHLLKQAGAEVIVASDGEEAIRILEKEPFDVILMDLHMPRMDGFATTLYLRKELGLDTPVLAITASAMKHERVHCLDAGMNDCMSKPFEFPELYQRITCLLQKTPETPVPEERRQNAELFSLTLLSQVGDADWVKDIVRTFVDSLPAQLHELQAAAATPDPENLHRIAHRLRGSTAMLQASPVSDRLGKLERLAHEKANGRSLLEELKPLFDQLLAGLRAFLTPENIDHEHISCRG